MPRRLLTVIVAAVLTTLTASMPAAAQLPSAGSDVVVVDPGEEPRQTLRYAWEADQRERLSSVLVVDMAASEAGRSVMQMELPVALTIDATVTKVDPGGSAWIALTFEEMVFGPLTASGAGVPDGDVVAAGFDEAMSAVTPLLAETRVWQQIDDRGQVIKTNVRFPDGFPVEAQQQIAQTTSSVALLPEEPVGVGARWEAIGTSVSQGVSISVVSTMELLEMDGDDITIALTLRLADDIETTVPTVNPFDEFALEGSGTYRLDLDGVYPREATLSMAMEMGGDLPNDEGTIVPVQMQVGVGMVMDTTEGPS